MIKKIVIISALLSSCSGDQNRDKINSDTLSQQKIEHKQNPVQKSTQSSDTTFPDYWSGFVDIVKKKNEQAFKKNSLDSIKCNGKVKGVNDFTNSYFGRVFDADLISRLSDNTKVSFSDFEIDNDALRKYDWVNKKIISNTIKQVVITKDSKHPEMPVTIVLEFVLTSIGYKFCGWKQFG